MVNNYIYII